MVANIAYFSDYKIYLIAAYVMMLLLNSSTLRLANAATSANGNAKRLGRTGGLLKSIVSVFGGVPFRN
jgi:hypothetical protein